MPRPVGWVPSRHARFARVAPAMGRHDYRDARGRFRRATATEALLSDIREARAATGKQQFDVFRGRLTDRHFAIRRRQFTPLDREEVQAIVGRVQRRVRQALYNRLIQTSPVDTGLLRSQWRLTPTGVSNRVPYVRQTEYVNRSSRGYIRRAVRYAVIMANKTRPKRPVQGRVKTIRL